MMRALALDIHLVETNTGVAYYRRLPPGECSLSGEGKTLKGLKGKMWVVDKIARILEELNIQKQYQDSLSRAYWVLAKDAKDIDQTIYIDAKIKKGLPAELW